MSLNTKRIALFLLVGILTSLILLTGSLSSLQLQPGNPFPGSAASNDDSQPVIPISPVQVYFPPLLRGVFALLLLIFVFYTLVRLIFHANLKIILWLFLSLVALIILAYLLPELTPAQPVYIPNESSEVTMVPTFEYPVTPLGQPPQVLIWFVIIIIVLGMGVLIFVMIKRWQSSGKIEADLLQQAEDAVDAIRAGMNLKNVVMRCYLQMTYTIQEEQGIERNDAMTAQEFENWLEQKGFPSVPVRQLTFLFEKVRYSQQQTSSDDEKIAMDSLNEIIQFCRNGRA